jgi:phosphoserine phosphatase
MLPSPLPAVLARLDRFSPGTPVVFDADGTLWRGDVGEDFFRWGAHRGLVHGRYETYEAHLERSPARAYAYCVEVLFGVEEPTLQAACDSFFAERYLGRVFPFVRPFLAELSRRGLVPWVCSASPRWTVLPGARALGIPPERVIGVTCDVLEGALVGPVHEPVPCGPGKVAWLKQKGVHPALAVGNGDLDLDMLALAEEALVVTPPDAVNQLVREGRARGWPILTA